MKLNKPPVSQEQTILEEYVEFLLTDLSNVHPISGEKHSSISELVADKTPEPKLAEEKASINQTSAEKIESEQAFITTDHQAEADEKKESPKWSTIEKAAAKRKPLTPVKVETVVKPSEHDQPKRSTRLESPTESLPESKPADFVEAPEEEQLKEWDAIITQEKEAAILAQQENSSQAKVAKSEKDVPAQAQIDTPSTTKAHKEKSQNLARETRKIIEEYLPPEKSGDPRLANVEKLLSRISLATMPQVSADSRPKTQKQQQIEVTSSQSAEQSAQVAEATFLRREAQKTRDILPEVFQTLIFQVGRLPLAVPLLKLGGIVKVSKEDITPLVGTPSWFMGLVPNDRGNLMVVDTQQYLMPEQVVADQEQDYQYLIVLDNSNWALACNSVGDAKNLTQQDIRWAEKTSRRPWFAGMVVDYMSALIEVDELINMLADNISE